MIHAIFTVDESERWSYTDKVGKRHDGFESKPAAVEHAAMSGVPVLITDMIPERKPARHKRTAQ
jgi:hypothetical protein